MRERGESLAGKLQAGGLVQVLGVNCSVILKWVLREKVETVGHTRELVGLM